MAYGLLIGVVAATLAVQADAASSTGAGLLLGPSMPLVFAALAQMFIILVGDFDLGVGYAVGLVNVLSATILPGDALLGWVAIALVVLGYIAMGAIVEFLEVPAIVVTLGASFVWLGTGLIVSPTPGGSAPGWLQSATTGVLPVVPVSIYIIVATAVLTWWVLRRWKYGIILRALGNSRTALKDAGRAPALARLSAYGIAGVLAVLAGLVTTGVTTSSDVNASAVLTLSTFVVVVIGGCRFTGGFVEPVGVVAAAVALSLLTSLLTFLNVNSIYDTAVEGGILVIAMSMKWSVDIVKRHVAR